MLKAAQWCVNNGLTPSKGAIRSTLSGQQQSLMTQATTRHFFASVAASGFDATFATEMGKFRVSPAAGWWLRSYGVLPSQVPATGPKGFIIKGDVLNHINTNNLSLKPREAVTHEVEAATPEVEAATPKAEAVVPKAEQAK